MLGLDSLDLLVNKEDGFVPTNYDYVLHYFLEQGVAFDSFIELPVPYILRMINTKMYLVDKEQKEIEKQRNG